jgi:hypothetical protein
VTNGCMHALTLARGYCKRVQAVTYQPTGGLRAVPLSWLAAPTADLDGSRPPARPTVGHMKVRPGEDEAARAWQRCPQLGRWMRPVQTDHLPRWQAAAGGAAAPVPQLPSEVLPEIFTPSDALDTPQRGARVPPPRPKEAAMSEATPAAEIAETFPEEPAAGVWTIHTVESWARAIIDDMAQEVGSGSGFGAVQLGATCRCVRFADGGFGAAIQIKGEHTTYSVHRVKVE